MLEAAIAPVSEHCSGSPIRRARAGRHRGSHSPVYADAGGQPWVPALIVQEVLAEGGRFREQFIENFAGRLAPLFAAIIRA